MPAEFALDVIDTMKDEDKPSTSGDELSQSSNNGFFTLASANGLKAVISNDSPITDGKVFIPTKVVELPTGHLTKSNTITGLDSDPLPLKISSVVSGEGVAFMTNGLPITHDSDESNDQPQISNVESLGPNSLLAFDETSDDEHSLMDNDLNDLNDFDLLEPKTEPIDISDDEQRDFNNDSTLDTNAMAEDLGQINHQPKGYIYCTTNVQLGKIDIEWISLHRIKLYLEQPVEIGCDDINHSRHLSTVSKYLQTYIRNRFLGVYPQHLRLDWIFIDSERYQTNAIVLCDFNQLDPLSVRLNFSMHFFNDLEFSTDELINKFLFLGCI